MEFEWDDEKRWKNIDKHGIDFEDAISVFDGRNALEGPGVSTIEDRHLITAVLDDGRWVTVVWTQRAEKRRIISARRARDAEKRKYRQLHNG